jgi:two-component system chemotaxis response regulator CheB
VDPTIAPDGPEFHDISGFTCPQCHGALWVRDLNPMLQYRCRTGHVFSQRTMVSEQDRMVDDALWAAIRSLEEQRALAQRLAGRFEKRGDAAAAARYGRKADVAARRAETLRQVLEPDDDS